jgi:hypothetical protein
VNSGFSAGVTDGGHTGISSFTGSFALDSSGRLNWTLIENFAHRALHDLAVVGKAVTAAYYGTAASYSYWNGCSTGGRQGLAEAQRYPTDYDGILSAAPAINWQKFIPAELWPELVMLRSGDVLPQCKLAAFQNARSRHVTRSETALPTASSATHSLATSIPRRWSEQARRAER